MADQPHWLDAVLGDTADGLYVVDHQHRIVRWNGGAQRLLGHSAEEVLNRHCHEVVAGCARDGSPVCGPACPVQCCVQRGELPRSMELHVLNKDGRRLWVHVSGIVIPNGRSPSIAHVLHDVSEGREAAEAVSRVFSALQSNSTLQKVDDAGPDRAGSGGGRPGPETVVITFTSREREVLRSLAAGQSNGAIAAQLGVSRFTVRSHVQHILCKAGVHNRSEAVAFAFRNHLL